MLKLSPVPRRILYVVLFELIAVGLITGYLVLFKFDGGNAFLVGVVSAVVAVIWNFIWNTIFEAWEKRQISGERTLKRRVVHAVGFEGGLILILVPIIAMILSVSLITAFFIEAGVLVFFLFYAFLFAWAFDRFVSPPPAEAELAA